MKNTHWEVLLLVKLQAKASYMGFFYVFYEDVNILCTLLRFSQCNFRYTVGVRDEHAPNISRPGNECLT